MRQAFFANLACIFGLTCAACGQVDVYGDFVSAVPKASIAADPARSDGGPLAVAPSPLGAEPPQETVATPLTISTELPAATTSTEQARPDAGQGDSSLEPVPQSDVLCLRSARDLSVCESARKQAFGRAICSCGDILGTGVFSTQTLGAADTAASVGANGQLSLRIGGRSAADDPAGTIEGALVLAGLGPSAISGSDATIRGPLELAGDLTFAGTVHVTGSVYARRLPRGSGTLSVDGDLHHEGEALGNNVPSNVVVGGKVVEAAHVTPLPCACSTTNTADFLTAISAAESSNDNQLSQLDQDSLSGLTAALSLELDSGRYYLRSVSSLSSIDWKIRGHVVVFVAGDFAVRGDVTVALAPDATLDIVIGGGLLLAAAARFGDIERPGASRLYVRGGVELSTGSEGGVPSRAGSATSASIFVGNLYAPAATLQLAPANDVYGSLFVRQLVVLQRLLVHYDPSVVTTPGARSEK
jgi:hypothetical protein